MKNTVLTILLMLIALRSSAMSDVYSPDQTYPFMIVTSDTVTEAPKFTDEEFYQISTSVVFKVNRTDISPDDPFFTIYNEEVRRYINTKHLQLRKIYVRGAASPEGPYENNKRLGRGRSNALLNELQRGLANQYMDVDREVSSITEDYGYLCVLMKRANDPDYATVAAIYDDCNGDELCCKKNLMKAQGGKLWARLLKEYFPQLRSARMILWFSTPDEKHAPLTINYMQIPVVSELSVGNVNLTLPEIVLEQPVTERRHLIAARTNLAHDFFYMPQFGWAPSPNIQLEYYPLTGHYTYNLGMTWGTNRKWEKQKFFQVRDFQFEVRRYFRGGGDFIGTYLGAYVHGNKYGIGLSPTKGWEGEGGGAGITFGYTTALNKKGSLRLELMVAAGALLTRYDPYVYGNPITGTIDGDYYYDYLGNASKFKKRNHNTFYCGPTNFGIQLTYDIIYRKRTKVQKGGAL